MNVQGIYGDGACPQQKKIGWNDLIEHSQKIQEAASKYNNSEIMPKFYNALNNSIFDINSNQEPNANQSPNNNQIQDLLSGTLETESPKF